MNNESENIARRAAGQLSGQFGAALPANLEAAIHGRADAPSTYEVATIIAVATLLLNIAKFAWDIHKDNLKSAAAPTQDSMARRIRMEVTLPDNVSPKQRDEMIKVVLEELPRS